MYDGIVFRFLSVLMPTVEVWTKRNRLRRRGPVVVEFGPFFPPQDRAINRHTGSCLDRGYLRLGGKFEACGVSAEITMKFFWPGVFLVASLAS